MSLGDLPRIERLDLSRVKLPDWHPEAAQGHVPVYGYVIDHPAGAIVFDTGVGFGNDFIDEVYRPASERLDAALGRLGLGLADVVAVVNSHLHFDHCGQNPLFFDNEVPIYAQAAEVETVEADDFYTDRSWAIGPTDQMHTFTGDLEIAEGVTVIATPGHTPGHQSLLIEAGGDRVVLGGQLVWGLDEFTAGQPSPTNLHGDEWAAEARDSINRVRALNARVVHFAHCAHHDAV